MVPRLFGLLCSVSCLWSLASAGAGTAYHWSFETPALPPNGTAAVFEKGVAPTAADTTFGPEVWDGGSYSRLLEANRHSMRFDAPPASGLGPVGGELRFDGGDGRFAYPSLTVEAFVRVDEHVGRFALIVSKRRAGNGATWSLSITPAGLFSVRLDTQTGESRAGFNRSISSGVSVLDGEWHHVAMTYDSETRECALYVDYRFCRKGTTQSPLVYDDAELTIGRGLNGWIDEVRISDKVLHPEQFLRRTKFFSDAVKQEHRVYDVMIDLTPTRVQTGLSLDWPKVGTLKPRSVDEIPGSFWSLGCETLDRDLADWDAYKGYLQPLGIKRIRLQGGWAKTEKKKGVYDFEWLDHIVDSAHELGLTVCMETSYGNRLYEPGAALGPGGVLPNGEETLAAWDAWVEAMVRRYSARGVHEWMMYNEPNLNRKNTPERVVAFNARTARIIKRIDPEAKIAGLVCSGLNLKWIENWLQGQKELGTLDLFEWVVYHGYGANPDRLAPGMAKAKALVRGYSPTLKLWQGEAGCASEEVQYALSGIDWTEMSHAKWNARRMLCDFAHGIESTVFTISDLSYHKDFISRYGLLKTNPDNSLIKVKAAYYVVNNLVSLFNGDVARNGALAIRFPGGETGLAAYGFTHTPTGLDMIALWDDSAIPVHRCDLRYVDLTATGLTMDDPVWVDLLTGRIYRIPADALSGGEGTTGFSRIPVIDSPVLIGDLKSLSYVKARETKKRRTKAAKKPEKPAQVQSRAGGMQAFRLFSAQKPAPALLIRLPADAPADWATAFGEALRDNGVHAFVLTDEDLGLAEAAASVRAHAAEWQVDPDQIGVFGPAAALAEGRAGTAPFAVLAGPAGDSKVNVAGDLLVIPAPDTKRAFDRQNPWFRNLLDWLEPRKTKVFDE